MFADGGGEGREGALVTNICEEEEEVDAIAGTEGET